MRKTLFTLVLILLFSTKSFAHYLWVETNPTGTINQEQEIKVFFGEYTYGLTEKVNGEAFPKVKNFSLWVIDAKGNKTEIKVTPTEDHYLGVFTPTSSGIYTVLLNNDSIDVIDYTQYNFGIFKTHYNSVAKIQVGDSTNNMNTFNNLGITIKDVSEGNEIIKLQVLYKNEPLAKNELKIYVSDLWTKTLETDENGYVSFKLPWNTKYIIETTFEERTPGIYKGEGYQFIWHCATYCIL